MRVSVGDRCEQRAVYLEELDRGLGIMSGFNLSDLFPTSRLARALGGGTLRAALEVRERIQSIVDAMVRDHKRAMESLEAAQADVGGHEREDILTTLLRFQRDGGMGITLTNENVNGVLFVSHHNSPPPTSTIASHPHVCTSKNRFPDIYIMLTGYFLGGL
jgi:hypothetical protein